jgi:multidrug efflux pump subunit AcrA (membrane-fusion protein)
MVTAKAKEERYGRLKAQNAVAGQDFDDAEATYLEAKANVESARLNLEYTTIRSPVNGKTGPILIQPGNMVSSTSSSSSSSTTNGISTANPLVTVNEIQPIKISLSLPQSDLPRIQAQLTKPGGLTITMNMRDVGGDDITVPVNFVSTGAGPAGGHHRGPVQHPARHAGAARSGQYRARRPVRVCGEGRRGRPAAGKDAVR